MERVDDLHPLMVAAQHGKMAIMGNEVIRMSCGRAGDHDIVIRVRIDDAGNPIDIQVTGSASSSMSATSLAMRWSATRNWSNLIISSSIWA